MQLRPSVKLILAAYLLAALLAVVISGLVIGVSNGDARWWLFLLLPGFIALIALVRHIRRRMTHLTVDAGRLRFQTGFLSRSVRTMELSKVQDVRVEQAFSQRILNVGNLSLETAGETSRLVMENVDQPQKHAEQILDLARHAVLQQAKNPLPNPLPNSTPDPIR